MNRKKELPPTGMMTASRSHNVLPSSLPIIVLATPAGRLFGVYTFILKRNHKKLKLKTRLSLLKEERQGVYLFILTDRR